MPTDVMIATGDDAGFKWTRGEGISRPIESDLDGTDLSSSFSTP